MLRVEAGAQSRAFGRSARAATAFVAAPMKWAMADCRFIPHVLIASARLTINRIALFSVESNGEYLPARTRLKDMTKHLRQSDLAGFCQNACDANEEPSLEELIWSYNKKQESWAIQTVMSFEKMFQDAPPSLSGAPWKFADLASAESFNGLCAGRGFYLILSDYVAPWDRRNACTHTVDGLPVLYRGQADKVRERLRSHLDNRRYLQMKADKKQSAWDRCLKLDEVKFNRGGISFDEAPFNRARWAAVVMPMPKSTSQMRELAEWAFDRVFGKPVASNERKLVPQAVKAAIDEERARAQAMASALEKFGGAGGC